MATQAQKDRKVTAAKRRKDEAEKRFNRAKDALVKAQAVFDKKVTKIANLEQALNDAVAVLQHAEATPVTGVRDEAIEAEIEATEAAVESDAVEDEGEDEGQDEAAPAAEVAPEPAWA